MTVFDDIQHHIYNAIAIASHMDLSEETASANNLHEALLNILGATITLNEQLKEKMK